MLNLVLVFIDFFGDCVVVSMVVVVICVVYLGVLVVVLGLFV